MGTNAQEQQILCCDVPRAQHGVLLLLREGSSGNADFVFTNPHLYLSVE